MREHKTAPVSELIDSLPDRGVTNDEVTEMEQRSDVLDVSYLRLANETYITALGVQTADGWRGLIYDEEEYKWVAVTDEYAGEEENTKEAVMRTLQRKM